VQKSLLSKVTPMEVVSLGTALSVLKSVATSAIKWTWEQVNRPWTEVPIRATIRPSDGSWHRVGFKCVNEKPYELEVLSVRTVKPKDLPLRRATGPPSKVWRSRNR